MNETNNATGIGMATECALLEHNLTTAINNSKASVSIIRLVLQNLLSQVQSVERTTIQAEQEEYQKRTSELSASALECTEDE